MIAIIGGSGLYDIEDIDIEREIVIDTPYGQSNEIMLGKLGQKKVAFLSRHKKGHLLPPSMVPYAANIWALKSIGARRIISISAVGSLREEIEPGTFIIVEDFIDRTYRRRNSFYDESLVMHTSLVPGHCPQLKKIIFEVSNGEVRTGGVYLCIEGPQFSTRAESHFHRKATNANVIGMTNATEFKLAREAGLCYISVSLVTDYDVWKEETVDAKKVLEVFNDNIQRVKKLIPIWIEAIPEDRKCNCKIFPRQALVSQLNDKTRAIYDFLSSE